MDTQKNLQLHKWLEISHLWRFTEILYGFTAVKREFHGDPRPLNHEIGFCRQPHTLPAISGR